MKKLILTVTFLAFYCVVIAQTDAEKARAKVGKAIELMDNGSIDESIVILEECEKLDPENYLYPYEIAFAYVKKKEYEKAIRILKKTLEYDNINSLVYQMLGNAYSYSGDEKRAIRTYEKGMKKFPNAGNLHLEKGNIFWFQEKYDEAVNNYRKGIEVDPMFASNYYRLALLYLSSSDKLTGLIYAEIFMNLERSSARTREISKLIYKTYKNAITLGKDESSMDFCEIVIDAKSLEDGGDLKLPLCAIFGKHFVLGMFGMEKVNSESIAKMRASFIERFFEEDYKQYSNVLFDYQKKLLDAGLLETYTRYILQMGDSKGFNEWAIANERKLNKFTDWYLDKENYMEVTQKNKFIN
ncbi:tetratricopeptide repeat protein [Kordia sp.]|uniref:tetratricopeptide repeat protein n=1 Tax=Kordia sp. TaxID=1965332 RepID=UPI003D6BDD49